MVTEGDHESDHQLVDGDCVESNRRGNSMSRDQMGGLMEDWNREEGESN